MHHFKQNLRTFFFWAKTKLVPLKGTIWVWDKNHPAKVKTPLFKLGDLVTYSQTGAKQVIVKIDIFDGGEVSYWVRPWFNKSEVAHSLSKDEFDEGYKGIGTVKYLYIDPPWNDPDHREVEL